jgi:hypothetical protein
VLGRFCGSVNSYSQEDEVCVQEEMLKKKRKKEVYACRVCLRA